MDAENLFIHENNWRPPSAAAEDRNNACKTLHLGGGADWQAPLAAAENRNEFTQAYGVIAAATGGRRPRRPRIAT